MQYLSTWRTVLMPINKAKTKHRVIHRCVFSAIGVFFPTQIHRLKIQIRVTLKRIDDLHPFKLHAVG